MQFPVCFVELTVQAKGSRAEGSWEGEWEAREWILEWSFSLCVGAVLSLPGAQVRSSSANQELTVKLTKEAD